MRRQLSIAAATAALLLAGGACGSDGSTGTDTPTTAEVANPASEYCVSQGGEVVIVTDADDGAQSGRCRLPDGTEVDEWEFYEASQDGSSTDE